MLLLQDVLRELLESCNMTDLCAIVIPLYKEQLSHYEELSFRQCLKVLNKYKIYFVTYKQLDLTEYDRIADEYNIQIEKLYFPESYFDGIEGYNLLMKSKTFYTSFVLYQYILIYQLDAFVFRDELDYWCNQGYDYIGAPWLTNTQEELLDVETWKVGNGGFSLRKVSFFIKVLSWKGPLLRYNYFKNLFYLPFMLGWQNRVKDFVKGPLNEDIFFTSFMSHTYFPPKLPTPRKAASFSFEKHPSYLYELCNHQLPFGCHAFKRFEYETFWKRFIASDDVSVR